MVEIRELPEVLRDPFSSNIRDVPQLKYVVEMSERICPDVGFIQYSRFLFQGGTCIFLKRYFDGNIDTSFMSEYQTNSDLQNTLEAYSIDPTAFWYLILFLKDYVDDESAGEESIPNAYTMIYELASRLNKMDFIENPLDGEYQGCKNEALLRFKIGKHWLDIRNDKALYGIFCALCCYLNKVQPRRRRELIDGEWEEVNSWDHEIEHDHLFTISLEHERDYIVIPETYKISYFTKYMREFLRSYKSPKVDWKISADKWLLISRVIYTIGYSNDIRYNTRRKPDGVHDLDFLKNNYKEDKYKHVVRREIYI